MMRYSLSWVSPKKMTPLGVAAPRGAFLLVLAVLMLFVKPLANVVGNPPCYDRQYK